MDRGYWSFRRPAGALLVGALAPLTLGVILFLTRTGLRRDALYWLERSSILTAALLLALGFVLLEAVLQATEGRVLARLGAAAYLVGAIVLIPAELLTLSATTIYPLVVVYVVLAFLGQAILGSALLRARLLPAWIGWTAVAFNVVVLAILLVVTPNNIYYPVVHHVAPLLIGLPLLLGAGGGAVEGTGTKR